MVHYSEDESRSYLIAELPERERPRERLLEKGSDALSEIELLAIVLKTGPRGKSTLDLAKDVLQHFNGSIVELASATPVELTRVNGIGKAKSAELKATFALGARLASHIIAEKDKITSPSEAAEYLRESFRGKKQEELRVLLLDTKNSVIKNELVTVGLLDRGQAHAREVFRSAIHHSAAKIILAHNHPSGDPTPSKQDVKCTEGLRSAGALLGIEVADHIIMGSRTESRAVDYFSFREGGLIS